MLAGLVSISTCAGLIKPWSACVIGLCGSLIYMLVCSAFKLFKIDDPLEVFPIYGLTALWSTIAGALFLPDDGLFWGGENAGNYLRNNLMAWAAVTIWAVFIC
jgi:Amt family ammonium transporter